MVKNIMYDIVQPENIFGSVGRSGGGYNTIWQDWTPEGREKRDKMLKEYEIGLNEICGHYEKLEKSILEKGFLEPIIVTCGEPLLRNKSHYPKEIYERPYKKKLILESITGGSRLWVAQKHNLPIPCIVNDYTGTYKSGTPIKTYNYLRSLFSDRTVKITMNRNRGVFLVYKKNKVSEHLGTKFSENIVIKKRAPLWVSLMNKYGYRVDRVSPELHELLDKAGIDQDEALKKYYGT